METKEELKRKLKEIEEKEYQEKIDLAYPKFKKMIGKCFSYRNSFSMPKKASDYWMLYRIIMDIKKEDLYVNSDRDVLSNCTAFQFQTDKNGEINVQTKERCYTHILGNEIPKDKFDEEWNKVKDKINNFKL